MSIALHDAKNREALAFLEKCNSENPLGGTHPDIRERIIALAQSRQDVTVADYRGAVLVVSTWTGVIVAVGMGMIYCLRTGDPDAVAEDVRRSMKFSNGDSFDVTKEFGRDWIIGGWNPKEVEWLQAVID